MRFAEGGCLPQHMKYVPTAVEEDYQDYPAKNSYHSPSVTPDSSDEEAYKLFQEQQTLKDTANAAFQSEYTDIQKFTVTEFSPQEKGVTTQRSKKIILYNIECQNTNRTIILTYHKSSEEGKTLQIKIHKWRNSINFEYQLDGTEWRKPKCTGSTRGEKRQALIDALQKENIELADEEQPLTIACDATKFTRPILRITMAQILSEALGMQLI